MHGRKKEQRREFLKTWIQDFFLLDSPSLSPAKSENLVLSSKVADGVFFATNLLI